MYYGCPVGCLEIGNVSETNLKIGLFCGGFPVSETFLLAWSPVIYSTIRLLLAGIGDSGQSPQLWGMEQPLRRNATDAPPNRGNSQFN